jgi:hypothetical protein
MLGTGTGSEIRQPLGYAMVGGLLVSQLLTLFTHAHRLHLHGPRRQLARWSIALAIARYGRCIRAAVARHPAGLDLDRGSRWARMMAEWSRRPLFLLRAC